MNGRAHEYTVTVRWTGNLGEGTANYRAYSRSHEVTGMGKPSIPGTSDPAFRGDPERYSPEDLLVAALSGCHMLWFLHLCADEGVVVLSYEDTAVGTMTEDGSGGGQFTSVTLRPRVTTARPVPVDQTERLHQRAHALCYIARSVNFPVGVESAAGVNPGT